MNLVTLTRSLAALAVLLASPAVAGPAADEAADRAALRALLERSEAANNTGDVAGWVATFAPDAVYMAPGAPPVTTQEGLVEVVRAGFRNRATIEIEPLETHVFGDWAFVRTAVTGSVRLYSNGEVVPVDVKEIAIFQRQPDGTWKIARLINNSNRE